MKAQTKLAMHNALPEECSIPIFPQSSKPKKGFEIERATFVELTCLLNSLSEKYRNELRRLIQDQRLMDSALTVNDLSRSYLEAEIYVSKLHIESVLKLYRQTFREAQAIQRRIGNLNHKSSGGAIVDVATSSVSGANA